MIEVSKCVVCEGAIRRLRRALVAPFLAERIWRCQPFLVDLVRCNTCGFTFYNPRLDTAEEHRLYSGYRSDEYQRMRYTSEPWYTSSFNTRLGLPGAYASRRSVVQSILHRHLPESRIDRVLDYGGNRGDLVDGLIEGSSAFVYDISSVAPVGSVTTTTDPRGCKADLIINTHVLEHVGNPTQLMRDIIEAAPVGGFVYVEVPCESACDVSRLLKRVGQMCVTSIARPKLARSVLRPSALYMMHEHVSYFTERSLATLIRRCGGVVIGVDSYILGGGTMTWCLASVT